MLLATINSGTLIIALPDLERALDTSILSLVWVILAYMISSTVLVLFAGRLSDLFGRKQAYVAGFVLFALASLGAGFAGGGTELILWRIAAGDRRRVPVRQLGRDRHRRVPARAARAGDGHEHDGRRGRPRDRAGARRRAGRDLLALGVLVQRAVRAARARCGRGSILRELAKPDRVRGYDVPGVLVFVVGLTGLVFGLSRGGPERLERPADDRRDRRRRRAAAAVRADRAPSPRADARPLDLREPAVRAPRPPRRSSTACRASRCCSCSSSTSRASRARTRSRRASSSRRWRSGC